MKTLLIALALIAASASAQASPKAEGLICDGSMNGQSFKVQIEVKTYEDDNDARLILTNTSNLLRPIGRLVVHKKKVQPIVNNELQKMDGVTLEAANSSTLLEFSVTGEDVYGNPRLSIEIAGDLNFKLESCSPYFDQDR